VRDTEPARAAEYNQRFVALQRKRQITERADTLGNFALTAAAARDWAQAVAQLKEAIDVCGDCRSKADLHKNLGLIYCRSGDLVNGEKELRLAAKMKPADPDISTSLELIAQIRQGSSAK